ncbi:MAG: radical SAM family heme chaperone HemW, partial [Proteobacteria bacterium]|nr:radical SAM family heme chaperone HemW [Pseudomonadota bacterium]
SLPPVGDVREDESRVRRFLEHLDREIALRSDELARQSIDTIFFGGGTPSLLPATSLEYILHLVKTRAHVCESAEVTLESNPGTVDATTLQAFRQAGVNRLSVGVQSFHDDDLRFLTRIHSSAQAEQTIKNARTAGFTNMNIDLMFGLPNQTPERWRANLEKAVSLGPSHLSCYSLTVEPHTVLANLVAARQVVPVSPELDADLYEQTAHVLSGYGYEQYEVSNFSLPGYRCRHNLTYWSHGEYLGFGPSAHSYLMGRRWWNLRSLAAYGDALEQGHKPVAGEESLSPEELMVEEVFLGLRSTGLELDEFRRRHQRLMPKGFEDRVGELLRRDLASTDGHRVWLTTRGYMICDELCAALAA